MLIPDVNVLIYAVNSASPQHAVARTWLEGAMNGHESIGFDWIVILGFVRISTHRSILPKPLDPVVAWEIVDEWLARPVAEIIVPDDAHIERLKSIADSLGTGGNLTTDAHIASMALGRRARVCSFDTDFDRIDGVERVAP